MKTSIIDIAIIWLASLGLLTTITAAQDEPKASSQEIEEHDDENEEHDDDDEVSVIDIEEFLEKHLPAYSEMLEGAKQESLHEYTEGLDRAADLYEEYHHILDDNEEIAVAFLEQHRIEAEVEHMARQWHKVGPGPKRKEIEKKMRMAIGNSFDLELIVLRAELEQMKVEVEEMEAELEEEEGARDEVIEESLEEYLHGDEEDEDHDDEEDDDE